jgi:hypothetical protein
MLISLLLKYLSYYTKHNRRKINKNQSIDITFHQKGKHFSKTDCRELQGILRTAKLLANLFPFVSWSNSCTVYRTSSGMS